MLVLTVFLSSLFNGVLGHGRVVNPPGRSSMWRYGYDTPANYNDNQLFCGGFYSQWTLNKGKCGVCGDAWESTRENEAGGKYATGIITRNYTKGQQISVTLEITATHKGYHEFRLCPVNDPTIRATQSCLDQNLLRGLNGETQFKEPGVTGSYTYNLILPNNLKCSQCVLQWKWNTGNSYNCDADKNCCIGCGPQEQFYGCSDIAILDSTSDNTNKATGNIHNNVIICLSLCFSVFMHVVLSHIKL